mmetsp:Transcript_52498/g.56982  ORF Transcript_52498/g.56982 Transcript_52498/m.56982 type:complete len:85 (-) Transcript_52498:110-364(-)
MPGNVMEMSLRARKLNDANIACAATILENYYQQQFLFSIIRTGRNYRHQCLHCYCVCSNNNNNNRRDVVILIELENWEYWRGII